MRPAERRVPACECDRFGAVECTSCRICEPHCPPRLDLARVVATSRRIAPPATSHQGLFATLATLEAQGAAGPLGRWHASRPGVVTGDDLVLFVGTAALMDAFFRRGTEYAAGPHAALLLLNAAGLRPRVMGGASGHDLWYSGRLEEFEALGRRLVPALGDAVGATGGGPVVCHSPEDAHALRDLHGVDAVTVCELLEGRDLELRMSGAARPRVALLDPCRLGRYRGAYDAPRRLLEMVADIVDLGWARGEEPCCGVSAWVNCNAWSKDHREAILRRAVEAGAEVLVTACPMCQVHMDCYYDEEGYDPEDPDVVPPLRIADLHVMVAELGGLLPRDRERMVPPLQPSPGDDAGVLAPIQPGPAERWLDGDSVRAAHQCTLCLRCVQECPQDAPVLEHVLRLRRTLRGAGLSPTGVADLVASTESLGNPFREPREGREEAYPPSLAGRVLEEGAEPPHVLLFLGCVYSYQDPRAVAAVARVMEAAGERFAVLGADEGCCGYTDHLAGADVEFAEVARERMAALGATGARTIVTPCSGCLRALSQLYPRLDEAWPGDIEVLHLSEYMDRRISSGDLALAEEGGVTMVAYHDPCDLGRHCGVYDAPRRVLAALPGVVVEEFPEARERAACCGGGGALRAFDTDASMDIARRRLETLVEGIDVVATCCPSCKGNLRLAAVKAAREGGPRPRVLDLAEVVASRLEGGVDR